MKPHKLSYLAVVDVIDRLSLNINTCAHEHGWYDKGERNFGEVITLMHSELSEAYEEYRNGHSLDEIYFAEGEKPEGIPVELADVIIRILDTCHENKIPIVDAILTKMDYNETRPYRHGGKLS